MTTDEDAPVPSDASASSEQPAQKPQAGKRPIGLFALPQWFRDRAHGTPPTEEERAKLKVWFAEQLRDRPLAPNAFRPPDALTTPPDEPEN